MQNTTLAEYLDRAQSLQQQDKLEQAIAICHQAIAAFPNDYRLYDCLGMALNAQRDLDSAIAAFRFGLELEPNSSWLYYRLANVLSEQGFVFEAIVNYRQSIKFNNDFPWCYYHLANLLREQGQIDEAITCYQNFIRLQDDFPWCYYHLANLLQQQHNIAEAIVNYQRAINLEIKDPWVHYHFAQALVKQKKFTDAIAQYYQGIALNPKLSLFYEKIYWLDKQIEPNKLGINSSAADSLLARAEAQTALEIDILRTEAEKFMAQAELNLALEAYQKIIALDNNYGNIYYRLAEIYQRQNQLDLAQQYYFQASISADFTVDSQVMLVCFSARHMTARCRYHFIDLLSDFPAKKLFIRDLQDVWYNQGLPGITQDVESTAIYLKNIIKQQNVNKIVFIGASSGGYAALIYGHLLAVNEIHAFGAQTKIPNNAAEIELLKNIQPKYFNLAKIYQANPNPSNCHLYFDTKFPPDVEHAYRLQDIENVELHGYCAGVGHKIAMWLKHQEMLKPILLQSLGMVY